MAYIPDGRAGWDELWRTSGEGKFLEPFWPEFDASQRALAAVTEGRVSLVSTIERMNPEGLAPGLLEFAHAVALDVESVALQAR